MKVLLVAINAKYIHSNLAVYSLCAYAASQGEHVRYQEYTINHQEEDILAGIYKEKPEVIAFSCYIWNIAVADRVAQELKKVLPDCHIWYGGPEVSYNSLEQLKTKPYLDGVMVGEGEMTLTELLPALREGRSLENVKGIAFRKPEPFYTGAREPVSLDELPFPYKDMTELENRIVYYESSRGCPYACSYCLSSIEKGIRFRSLGLVKEELAFLMEKEVPQVKFIDRTFNCRHDHAMAIWQFMKERDKGKTNFHFEISADLLQEEEISFLNTLRPGLVQLEIGVQSIYGETIQAIHRQMDIGRLKWAVDGIKKGKNIHQHLDLIAGLPFEDLEQFKKSFDFVYGLKPEQLQLGFLKVLKGAQMERDAGKYGLVYQSGPPFEVLRTSWLSYDDVLLLKQVEEMTEVYYNSGQFEASLGFLEHFYVSAFALFEELGIYYERKGYFKINHKRTARYEILLDFVKEKHLAASEIFQELLTYDLYLRENLKSRTAFMKDTSSCKEELKMLCSCIFHEKPGQGLHGEWFSFDVEQTVETGERTGSPRWIFFDYRKRNPLNRQATVVVIEKGSL